MRDPNSRHHASSAWVDISLLSLYTYSNLLSVTSSTTMSWWGERSSSVVWSLHTHSPFSLSTSPHSLCVWLTLSISCILSWVHTSRKSLLFPSCSESIARSSCQIYSTIWCHTCLSLRYSLGHQEILETSLHGDLSDKKEGQSRHPGRHRAKAVVDKSVDAVFPLVIITTTFTESDTVSEIY